jgi:hypothetical protein
MRRRLGPSKDVGGLGGHTAGAGLARAYRRVTRTRKPAGDQWAGRNSGCFAGEGCFEGFRLADSPAGAEPVAMDWAIAFDVSKPERSART